MDLFNKSAVHSPEAAKYQQAYAARLAEQADRDAPKPNGDGIPGGSYLGSCSGCSLRNAGMQLHCSHCRLPGSPSLASSLEMEACPPPSLVDNIHGELQCKPPPNADNIPPGGYRNSCGGCKLAHEGRILGCSQCGTSDGNRKAASYDMTRCLPPSTLDNQDGVLVCLLAEANEAGIPAGGYQGSCLGCKVLSGTLHCSHCLTSARQQKDSSIKVEECAPPRTIHNSDGRLTCSHHIIPMVRGS